MPGDLIDSGLITGLVVALAGGLVQLLVWRLRGRTAERLKGIDPAASRNDRALEAEDKAFGYMQKALEDSRKEADDAREEARQEIAATSRRADAEIGSLKIALAQEQQAKIDALADAFNVRTLAQSLQTAHDVEVSSLRAELVACRWREQEARLWIASAQRATADYDIPELPPAPYWADAGPAELPPAPDEEK